MRHSAVRGVGPQVRRIAALREAYLSNYCSIQHQKTRLTVLVKVAGALSPFIYARHPAMRLKSDRHTGILEVEQRQNAPAVEQQQHHQHLRQQRALR